MIYSVDRIDQCLTLQDQYRENCIIMVNFEI